MKQDESCLFSILLTLQLCLRKNNSENKAGAFRLGFHGDGRVVIFYAIAVVVVAVIVVVVVIVDVESVFVRIRLGRRNLFGAGVSRGGAVTSFDPNDGKMELEN